MTQLKIYDRDRAEGLNACPEKAFFKFKGLCPIRTCQYNNRKTSRGCLSLDRKESSTKSISDSELHYFKFSGSKSVNLRNVATRRKCAITRVKNIIILQYYIFYLFDNFKPEESEVYKQGISVRVDTLISSYPLSIPRLKFKTWMLPHLVNENILQDYLNKSVSHLSSDINLKNMLNLVPKKLAKLQLDIQRMYN
jgi:hypothetical protein